VKKILSWFQRCNLKGEIWHSSMSWWHICAKQALHRILFYIMCFTNCTPVIKPTVSREDDSDSKLPINEKFLFISSVLYQQWTRIGLQWELGLSFQRLQVEIIYYSLQACFSQGSVVARKDLGHWWKADLCSNLVKRWLSEQVYVSGLGVQTLTWGKWMPLSLILLLCEMEWIISSLRCY